MCKSSNPRIGAWIAIAVGVAIALLNSVVAFGQDRLTADRLGAETGPAVVFVPGLGTPGAVYEPYVHTRPDLDAHLVTFAGFGGAPALDPSEGVIEPGAQALAEYLRQEGLSDAVLVGHSLGAQIALQAAAQAPEHVARVVVVDSLPFFPGLLNPAADPAMAQAQGEAFAAQMAAMDRDSFMAQVRQGAPIQATAPEHQAQVVGYVAASDQATVVRGMYEALSRDWRPILDAVEAPVTVLVPHNGFVGVPVDALAARYSAQYQAIEALDVRVVADSRHFIMLDQPERFAEELARVVGAPS